MRTVSGLLVLGVLAIGMSALVGAGAAGGQSIAAPSAQILADTVEKHPKIRAAIEALRLAREELKEAAHDFGGHREDALKSVAGALKQLRTCLEVDVKSSGQTPATNLVEGTEKHPKIHAAIDALKLAREELKEAAHDFGGHREDAVKAIDAALKDLRVCLEYDAK